MWNNNTLFAQYTIIVHTLGSVSVNPNLDCGILLKYF